MSDSEDDYITETPAKRRRPDPEDDDLGDDLDDEVEPQPSNRKKEKRRIDEDEEMDDEELEDLDEDEEDEEDEEEDEDEDDNPRRRKRPRERRNQFVDIEAEVDEDEEDFEEDEDDLNRENDFVIANDEDDVGTTRFDDRHHRELDRQHQVNLAQDAETLAARYRDQYGRQAKSGMTEGSAAIPKRLLLPSVDDPSIWGIKCKPGKEQEIVLALMKRVEEYRYTRTPLNIISVLERAESMQGYVYVEAKTQADVAAATQNVNFLYARQMLLVPITEMPDLLRVQKKAEILPGAYVRFKRGKYAGDLAQVENVESSGQMVRIRAVPRIDYNAASANEILRVDGNDDGAGAGKRKRPIGGIGRPAQRLFSEVEAKKWHPRELSPPQRVGKRVIYQFMGETYENGYWCKDVKLSALITENVNPKLEEVTRFAQGAEDGTEHIDLHALAQSLKATTDKSGTYVPGDMVEVYAGEQAGIVGKVKSIQNDIVSMNVTEGDLRGQTIDVPFKGLRKRFKEGDHVKVTGGSKYRDEVGMIVKIVDDKVTFLSDLSMLEYTVFSKDLREASDSSGMGAAKGRYDLWDLVQLDSTTVACITKIDRESIRVLDQNATNRTVLPSQIVSKIPSKRFGAVATDRNGSEIRVEDTVKEVAGGENRTGAILHLHRGFAFIHSKELQSESGGVFVARTSNLATMIAKGGRIASAGPDLSKMNPAVQRDKNAKMAPPPVPRQGGRDKTIAQTVTIRQGPYKGLLGIIKDATDTTARVELHTKSKTITIEKTKLGFKDQSGRRMTYEEFVSPRGRGGGGGNFGGSGGGSGPSSSSGSATPGWSGGRTPAGDRSMGWQGSRTPAAAHGSGGRTPAWSSSGDGGRTPAWRSNDGSRTANPYDGSRTSYGGSGGGGGRTPAWNPGSRTPYMGSDSNSGSSVWDSGSKTPGRPSASDANATWNDNYNSSSNARTPAAYNATSPDFELSAPTPGASGLSAPTPGALNAPTPAPVSAPTPRAAASTPWDSAPTPGPISAATPGASGGQGRYYDAPTPGGFNPKTPGAGWEGNNDDDDDGPRYASESPSP